MQSFYIHITDNILNLIIDIGNNSSKFFLFQGDAIILKGRRENTALNFIADIAKEYEVKNIIVSSVVEFKEKDKEKLFAEYPDTIWFTSATPLPINILYRTPQKLGSDRLAAAIGAISEAPGKDILIIDAGSAITIDFVDAQGKFLGGNISPGIKMRLTALHQFTSKLPQVEKEGETPAIGYDTETAIRCGVIWGVCHEIDGYINYFRQKYPDLLVFLTGGDEKALIGKIKNRIFADKFLVAKGLNRILTENGSK